MTGRVSRGDASNRWPAQWRRDAFTALEVFLRGEGTAPASSSRRGPSSRRGSARGFSLVEVVLAVAVLAGAVTIMLALLPSLARQTARAAEERVAYGLPEAVRGELRRLAAGRGFTAMANAIPVMRAPLEGGFSLVASRDALRLQPLDEATLAANDQYFQIEVWRFADPPLAFDASRPVLAVEVRVSWPHRVPGVAEAVPASQRSRFSFATAIGR